MKIEIELPEINGFEYTGEYRKPEKDEWLMDDDGATIEFNRLDCKDVGSYPILRKLTPKREFTDGAFYPVIINSVEVVRRYDSESNEFDSVRADYNGLTWIGEEIKIKWGEE